MRISGFDHTSEDRHIIWELDGGGSAHHDFVQLFEGRLYTSRLPLIAAKLRAKQKFAARALAGFLPFFFT